jgi:hypothetical protein
MFIITIVADQCSLYTDPDPARKMFGSGQNTAFYKKYVETSVTFISFAFYCSSCEKIVKNYLKSSVGDPLNFGADPDRIRISLVTLRMQKK